MSSRRLATGGVARLSRSYPLPTPGGAGDAVRRSPRGGLKHLVDPLQLCNLTTQPTVLLDQLCRRPIIAPTAIVTAATRICSETVTKLPAGGHESCPLVAMGSA